MNERRRLQIEGIVQGVGFRPFVYNLARRAGLVGEVLNDASGVTIVVEGETAVLNTFTAALRSDAPPLALIERITTENLTVSTNGHTLDSFTIGSSQPSDSRSAFISPDIASCDDCLREMFDPEDRRFRYPFINCTNCGPRFTIIEDVPYDRPFTTMSPFEMCADCLAEYQDPTNRRFHAQPNACPACGPQLQLLMNDGQELIGSTVKDMVQQAQLLLRQGEIVAVKGLGGFHLACDATNAQTVQRLRTLKHRWDKPFALMAADLNVVYTICEIDATEIELLTNRKRPIVLLKAKQRTAVAPAVAPNQKTLGVMLPYTPLHHLLLAASPVSLLVMTSANLSDEPIIYRDEEVTEKLDAISDFVLTHNRTIHMRCDDTVFQVVNGLKQPLRRSRGYAPQPLSLGFEFHQPVLAVGAHLKNTFCLGKNRHAFLSHHIGDLENLETLTSFQEGVKHFDRLFDISPQIVAHDLHPDYLSSRYALELENLTPIAVQHHHAHIASVMAEHKLTEPLIGVAFDGSGYGPDGTIWGGEFLVADLGNFERVAHLRQVALPGGEKAIHQPWRVAAAWLQQLYGDEWLTWELPFSQNLDGRSWQVMKQMIEQELNSPQTSSMGRLFDAVAALIGLRQAVTYEGQAAIELEAIADKSISDRYDFCLRWPALDPGPLFEEVIADLQKNVPTPVIAAKFHNSIAGVITAVCLKLRQERGLNQVALSGGVFQNAFLLSRTMEWLHKNEFELFINQQVPPNDGGIALGQAAIAAVQTSDTPDFSYPSEPVTEQHKEKPCV